MSTVSQRIAAAAAATAPSSATASAAPATKTGRRRKSGHTSRTKRRREREQAARQAAEREAEAEQAANESTKKKAGGAEEDVSPELLLEVLAQTDEVIKSHPDRLASYHDRALIHLMLGRLSEAHSDCALALELSPSSNAEFRKTFVDVQKRLAGRTKSERAALVREAEKRKRELRDNLVAFRRRKANERGAAAQAGETGAKATCDTAAKSKGAAGGLPDTGGGVAKESAKASQLTRNAEQLKSGNATQTIAGRIMLKAVAQIVRQHPSTEHARQGNSCNMTHVLSALNHHVHTLVSQSQARHSDGRNLPAALPKFAALWNDGKCLFGRGTRPGLNSMLKDPKKFLSQQHGGLQQFLHKHAAYFSTALNGQAVALVFPHFDLDIFTGEVAGASGIAAAKAGARGTGAGAGAGQGKGISGGAGGAGGNGNTAAAGRDRGRKQQQVEQQSKVQKAEQKQLEKQKLLLKQQQEQLQGRDRGRKQQQVEQQSKVQKAEQKQLEKQKLLLKQQQEQLQRQHQQHKQHVARQQELRKSEQALLQRQRQQQQREGARAARQQLSRQQKQQQRRLQRQTQKQQERKQERQRMLNVQGRSPSGQAAYSGGGGGGEEYFWAEEDGYDAYRYSHRSPSSNTETELGMPPPAPHMPGRANSSGLHAGASVFVPSGGARAATGVTMKPRSSVQDAEWFKQLKQVAGETGSRDDHINGSGGSGGVAAVNRGGVARGDGGGGGSANPNSSANSAVGWDSKPTNAIDIDAAFGGASSAAGLFTGLRMT